MPSWYILLYKLLKKIAGKHLRQEIKMYIRKLECFVIRLFFPNPILIGPWKFHWQPDVWSVVRAFAAGIYEPNTSKLFLERIYPGMVVVDVGANFGLYTLLAASKLTGAGKVFAFEPNPNMFSLLQKNISTNGYAEFVRAEPLAISNQCGTVLLTVPPFSSGTGYIATRYRRAKHG